MIKNEPAFGGEVCNIQLVMHGCGCVSFPFNETNEIKYKVR